MLNRFLLASVFSLTTIFISNMARSECNLKTPLQGRLPYLPFTGDFKENEYPVPQGFYFLDEMENRCRAGQQTFCQRYEQRRRELQTGTSEETLLYHQCGSLPLKPDFPQKGSGMEPR
ncbi:hypothetical protein [Nostoc parmelioides]|uniref:Uncharacterized protein n=1 Tax=Nostoc parmelioides FACHB-3921 TaxID=2692909 RepID=A0ABR8BNT2_9NOSO|nr:hypothetical protein [Nostoc parmelioides]MBD2255225.1 hypothetical protein [Nostoc parmelioides FACHB-3921]